MQSLSLCKSWKLRIISNLFEINESGCEQVRIWQDKCLVFYKNDLSLCHLLITFQKIYFVNLFVNAIQYSTKIVAKYKNGLKLYWNEFTMDKYQKCVDIKCVPLKKYVNIAIVKYFTAPQWNICGGVYL